MICSIRLLEGCEIEPVDLRIDHICTTRKYIADGVSVTIPSRDHFFTSVALALARAITSLQIQQASEDTSIKGWMLGLRICNSYWSARRMRAQATPSNDCKSKFHPELVFKGSILSLSTGRKRHSQIVLCKKNSHSGNIGSYSTWRLLSSPRFRICSSDAPRNGERLVINSPRTRRYANATRGLYPQ